MHTTVFFLLLSVGFGGAWRGRPLGTVRFCKHTLAWTMLKAMRLAFTEEEIRRCKSTPPPNNHLVDPIEGPVSSEICVLHKDKLQVILSSYPRGAKKGVIRSGLKELDTRHLFELSQRRTPAERKDFYKKESAPLYEMLNHVKTRKRKHPDSSKLPEFQSLKDLVQKPSPKSKNHSESDDDDEQPESDDDDDDTDEEFEYELNTLQSMLDTTMDQLDEVAIHIYIFSIGLFTYVWFIYSIYTYFIEVGKLPGEENAETVEKLRTQLSGIAENIGSLHKMMQCDEEAGDLLFFCTWHTRVSWA